MDEPRANDRHLEPKYFFKIDLFFFLLIIVNALLYRMPAWHNLPIPIFVSKYEPSLRKFGFSSEDIDAFLRSVNAGFLIDCIFFAVRLCAELNYRETKLSENNVLYFYFAGAFMMLVYFFLTDFTNGSSIYELTVRRPMFINVFILSMVGFAFATSVEKGIAQQLAFHK